MKTIFAILFFGPYLLLLNTAVSSCVSPEERAGPQVKSAQPAFAVAEGKTDTVKIIAMKFVPAVLTVTPGTAIVFINNDMVTHDIKEETTKAWSSGLLSPSKTWSMIADKSADYYCSIHAVMKGKIVVNR